VGRGEGEGVASSVSRWELLIRHFPIAGGGLEERQKGWGIPLADSWRRGESRPSPPHGRDLPNDFKRRDKKRGGEERLMSGVLKKRAIIEKGALSGARREASTRERGRRKKEGKIFEKRQFFRNGELEEGKEMSRSSCLESQTTRKWKRGRKRETLPFRRCAGSGKKVV